MFFILGVFFVDLYGGLFGAEIEKGYDICRSREGGGRVLLSILFLEKFFINISLSLSLLLLDSLPSHRFSPAHTVKSVKG